MKITSVLRKNTEIAFFSFMLLIVYTPFVHAQSNSAIAQTFKAAASKEDIVTGALVSTTTKDNTVELATLATANRLVGVIASRPLVSLSTNNQDTEVVLSGTTNVLVSDINGAIAIGDKITVSPIAGIGMKATSNSQIVGTAQGGLTQKTTQNVTDRDGKRHQIHAGYVQVQIGVTAYQPADGNLLPPFLQNMANNVAGRTVSVMRVLICSVLLLLGFATVLTLVYTSTRSAITSLGRNPLAAHAIRRGLYQIGALSILVIGTTLLASYLILTI